MQDTNNPLAEDEEFISSQANLTAEEYENVRRGGASVPVAQECAMAVLMDGL